MPRLGQHNPGACQSVPACGLGVLLPCGIPNGCKIKCKMVQAADRLAVREADVAAQRAAAAQLREELAEARRLREQEAAKAAAEAAARASATAARKKVGGGCRRRVARRVEGIP